MPNDVREMTDKELLQGLMAACLGFDQETGGEVAIGKAQTQIEMCRDELARRLSALRAEVDRFKAELDRRPTDDDAALLDMICSDDPGERLAAHFALSRRIPVMRELGEAADSHFGETGVSSMNYDSYLRWFGSLNAYRAMKGEWNGVD